VCKAPANPSSPRRKSCRVPKNFKITIGGKAYYVHVRDIHRALEDAKFKAYILKLAAPSKTTMENKEVAIFNAKP
jgi:hypothetical protein